MFDFKNALEAVLNDPALADVKPPKKRQTSADRLIALFKEVEDFYEAYGRLPEECPEENRIFHRWIGIIKSEKKIEHCRPYDTYGILPPPAQILEGPQPENHLELTEEQQLEAVLNDPLLADIEAGDDLGLFDIPDYMRQRLNARKEAEYVGKRRPCEDFDKYADGFREIQQGLKSGKYRLVKFSEPNLKVGTFFVEDGIIGYLATFENEGKNNHGRVDGRTRVIYENGSEADIKFRTITKNLSVNGYSILNFSELSDKELEQCFTLTEKDVESGTIYVLRSKSIRPEIAAIKDLYKIGFTVTSVESRIANAKNEPTYLCADVEVVATWKVYNVKSSTFEALIHKLFASVQLQVTVDGHRPKEWFIVPLKVIEEAVRAIILHKRIEYNPIFQQITYL